MKVVNILRQIAYGGLFLWVGLILLFLAHGGGPMTPYYDSSVPLMPIAAFYFGVFRPQLKNAFFAFILGFLMDIMGFYPPGVHAFLLTLLFFIPSLNTRTLPHLTFNALWGIFAGADAVYMLALKGLVWGITGESGTGTDFVLQYGLTLAFFPIVAGICGVLNNKLVREAA